MRSTVYMLTTSCNTQPYSYCRKSSYNCTTTQNIHYNVSSAWSKTIVYFTQAGDAWKL